VVVAAYENPMLRNLRVDMRRYPEVVRALETRQVVLVQDVLTDPLFQDARAEWEAEGRMVPTRSVIALPFTLRDQPAGIFFIRTTAEDPPLNRQDVEFAEQVIHAAVAALEKAYDLENAVLGQEQMRQLAETDPLTETFNRRALTEKLQQEIERANRYATFLTCLMIDIDNFKLINDTYGHLVGDQVLLHVAKIFQSTARASDLIGRYGGEEFALILRRTDRAGAAVLAGKLRKALVERPAVVGNETIPVRVCMGIACYPADATSASTVAAMADEALYRAKAGGRDRVDFADENPGME
jgi:two-component system cell cycle response regulator